MKAQRILSHDGRPARFDSPAPGAYVLLVPVAEFLPCA